MGLLKRCPSPLSAPLPPPPRGGGTWRDKAWAAGGRRPSSSLAQAEQVPHLVEELRLTQPWGERIRNLLYILRDLGGF